MPPAQVWGNRPARNGWGMYGRSGIFVQPCRNCRILHGLFLLCYEHEKDATHGGWLWQAKKHVFKKRATKRGDYFIPVMVVYVYSQ